MELKLGNSCGSCIHSNRPKKPRDHAAHYEVAKTERWCYLHNCHITRETTCDNYEGINRAAKTALTRTKTYNERRLKILELVELLGDKKIITNSYIYFVENGWISYVYGKSIDDFNSNYRSVWKLSSKESSTNRKIQEIFEYLNK